MEEFAAGIKDKHGCELNTRKRNMYSIEEDRCKEAKREGDIPDNLQHVEKGGLRQRVGGCFKRDCDLQRPGRRKGYVEAVLRHKAREVGQVTR